MSSKISSEEAQEIVRRGHLYILSAGTGVGLLSGAFVVYRGGGGREAFVAAISSVAGAAIAEGLLFLASTASREGSTNRELRRLEEWGAALSLTPLPALIGALTVTCCTIFTKSR